MVADIFILLLQQKTMQSADSNVRRSGSLRRQVRCTIFLALAAGAICVIPTTPIVAQDGGWTTPVSISGNHTLPEYPAMAVGQDGKIFVVWDEENQLPDTRWRQLFFAEFNGHEWSTPVVLSDTGTVNWTPDIAVDSLGLVHVVWLGGTLDSSVTLYRTFDGFTWSAPVSLPPLWSFPKIAIDHKAGIHVVANDGHGVSYRRYDGSAWSAPINISDSLTPAGFPAIAVDSKNNVHVAFHAYDPTMTRSTEIYYRKGGAEGWSSIARITTDSMESESPDIILTKTDLPVIVWSQSNYPLPSVKVQVSGSDGMSWSVPQIVSDTTDSYEVSAATDGYGHIHLAWQVWNRLTRRGGLLYTNNSKGDWAPPEDITGNSAFGAYAWPTLRFDKDGKGHAVWLAINESPYPGTASILYARNDLTLGLPEKQVTFPREASLLQNFPYPFNPTTTIHDALPSRAYVTLSVFNTLGQQVATLVNESQEAGYHNVRFDATGLASGVYFYRLMAGEYMASKRLVLVR